MGLNREIRNFNLEREVTKIGKLCSSSQWEFLEKATKNPGSCDPWEMETRPAIQETQVRSLGQKDSLEKEMATHFSVLTWRICWTEELDGLYIPWGIRLHIESYTCDKGKLTSVLGEI